MPRPFLGVATYCPQECKRGDAFVRAQPKLAHQVIVRFKPRSQEALNANVETFVSGVFHGGVQASVHSPALLACRKEREEGKPDRLGGPVYIPCRASFFIGRRLVSFKGCLLLR